MTDQLEAVVTMLVRHAEHITGVVEVQGVTVEVPSLAVDANASPAACHEQLLKCACCTYDHIFNGNN